MTKQTIGKLVGELEAKGYIGREVDPDDQRAAVITYTPAGWGFLQGAHQVKQAIEAEYTSVLGEEGMQRLQQILQQVVRSRPVLELE